MVTDWGRVVGFTPELYFRPKSLDDLKAFLTQQLLHPVTGKSLRFLGGLHSCSEIFESDVVVDTSGLPLEFEVTQLPGGGNLVVASAFMHAHDFLARAAGHNLSLTALGGTDAQTLAGLISTNTAGATIHTSVYETVAWVEYLTVAPDGQSIILQTTASTDADFQATICSLGLLGFLTRVGFNLVEQTYYVGTFQVRPLDEILGDVAKTCADHEFWRIEWIPNDEKSGLFWNAQPFAGPRDPNGDYPVDGSEKILELILKIDEGLFKNGPFLNLPLQAAYGLIAANYGTTTATGPMRYIIPCDRLAPMRVAMAEWSFNPADLTRLMATCRTYFAANKWPNLPIEIECTRTDSYMMSAWNWPGLPYIIKFNFQYLTDFLTDEDKQAMIDHLHGLWNALEAAGIPFKAHWGKINFLNPVTVGKSYDLAAFVPHIRSLFLNDSLRQRLLDTPA